MKKLNLASPGRWLSLACASLGMLLLLPRSANAQSALTWARVELTRNQVQLFTNGQSRRARVSDVLGVGDALSTARRARAELRFNDGSLARIGESAVFQFTPNTRNFRLSNGTVLLLIPPGQGRTTIQTPNAVTGIHGSALFVRFIPETDTTIIGALTNNLAGPMVVFNLDGSQQQPLYAGEMAVMRGDGTLEQFVFELETFYETSDLVVGLELDNLDSEIGDQAIDAVREEIKDALEQQERFEDNDDVIENPSFLAATPVLTTTRERLATTNAIPDFSASPAAAFLQQSGFESVVSGTVNQPVATPVPPTITGIPNPRPSVANRPPAPTPNPSATPPTNPPTPIAGPSPNPPEPTPGEIPNQPIEKPPTLVFPDGNIVVESVEPLPSFVQPEPTVPETTAPTPVIVVAPEPTVLPTEVITPVIEKPPIPIVPVESIAPPVEATVVPTTETVIPAAEIPEEINLLETVPELETEAQVDRLPDVIVVSDPSTEPPPETTTAISEPPNGETLPPGQTGNTPGQSGAQPPGQAGNTPGQGGT